MTAIPWLSFAGFSVTRRPQLDAIPLIAYGKVMKDADRNGPPINISFHHALVDGLHVARYVEYIEEGARELARSFG